MNRLSKTLLLPVSLASLAAIAACSSVSGSSEPLGKSQSAVVTPQTGGFVVVSGDDADDSGGHCQGTLCGGLYPAFFKQGILKSLSGGTGILAVGVNGSTAVAALQSWNDPANGGPGVAITHARTNAEIAAANLSSFAMIYVPSYSQQTPGGITATQIAALNLRQADIRTFVNVKGGSLIALTQSAAPAGWGFLPVTLTTRDETFANASPTAELTSIAPGTTTANLTHTNGALFHNVFTGPAGYSGLSVLAYRTNTSAPVILGGVRVVLTAEQCADGLDNDGDGLADRDDPDCQICGDGVLDPGEECDDGARVNGDGCSDTCKVENRAPVAVCRDADVCADAACVASAEINGGSSDPDGDPLTTLQSPQPPYSLGVTPVTLTVSDGKAEASCSANVTVRDCTPPAIACPASTTLECVSGGASFTPADASASDNCGAPSVAAPASGVLTLGDHVLTYSATDGTGNGASCTTTVSVVDTQAPAVSAAREVRIWPPNHKYVRVDLAACGVTIADACHGSLPLSSSNAHIVSVSSDEPVDTTGDGNTAADIVFVDAQTIQVRAERRGNSDGRVYTVKFAVSDPSNQTATATCKIVVPHAASDTSAVDSGASYTVLAP